MFVAVYSQLWKTPMVGETERRHAWLKRTLERATNHHQRVFIVIHHPLYTKEAEDPENYFNLPPAKRKELLSLFENAQ